MKKHIKLRNLQTDMVILQSKTYQDNTLPTEIGCENSHRGIKWSLPHRCTCQKNGNCSSCQQPDEEENIEHILCHCTACNRTRTSLCGNYILSSLSEIMATDIRDILKFVLHSK